MYKCTNHNFSTLTKYLTSKEIRNIFLEYFLEREHKFIKSSSVIPFQDHGLPFVNAGMNQFKSIFLGKSPITVNRATNSQKCIRIGGKHNDIDSVGLDNYHHTFFEMLGNWSFNDYFKLEACQMSLELLTKVYGLNQNQLYFTYFGGDARQGLNPDTETKEIWRSLGIKDDRILPFDMKDNFWEMGLTGPCGPCTEIHFDHMAGRTNAQALVNQSLNDLTEIWNIVFIQYNRLPNGDLIKLDKYFVDTGMGFERLVAILQKQNSNYNTDLFIPLFNAIEKVSGVKGYEDRYDETAFLPQAYRILADHARMITISLADGMLPDENHRLRKVMRKAFSINKNFFKNSKGLLLELSNHVAEILGEAYPEIYKNFNKVKLLIEHEERLISELKKETDYEWNKLILKHPELNSLDILASPGIIQGFKKIQKFLIESKDKILPPEIAFQIQTTCGINQNELEFIANMNNVSSDWEKVSQIANSSKLKNKGSYSFGVEYSNILNQLKSNSIPETDNSLKYTYFCTNDKYIFPSLRCRILAIIENGKLVSNPTSRKFSVILDSSNLYFCSGGQNSDCGLLYKDSHKCFEIEHVENVNNYIIHHGHLIDGQLNVGDIMELKINEEKRLRNMQNHTATHLLNAILHEYLPVTCQKSSHITDKYFTFDFAAYGKKININDLKSIEEQLNILIKQKCPVIRKVISQDEFIKEEGLIMIPGETYSSDQISLIEIHTQDDVYREPCCGTHLYSTDHIQDFSILHFKSGGSNILHIRAVTGEDAINSKNIALSYRSRLEKLNEDAKENKPFESEFKKLRQEILESQQLPFVEKEQLISDMEPLKRIIKYSIRKVLRSSAREEMAALLNNKDDTKPIVYFLKSTSTWDTVSLQELIDMNDDRPIFLFSFSKRMLKAKCRVPKEIISEHFNAKLWMESVLPLFHGEGAFYRNIDPHYLYKMNILKIHQKKVIKTMPKAIEIAKNFAEMKLNS